MKQRNASITWSSLVAISALAALATGCNGESGSGSASALTDAVAKVEPVPGPAPTPTGAPAPAPTEPVPSDRQFKSCQDTEFCLSLKYVVYRNTSGVPSADEAKAEENVQYINSLWKTCGVAFQIDEYLAVDPTDYGLSNGAESYNELNSIRRAFQDNSKILSVTAGSWSGSIVGWTTMPGTTPYGAVMSSYVSDTPEIIAHELGHYLGLDHASNSSNLMNPVIYSTSTALNSSQCSAARSTIQSYWSNMLM